MITASTVRRREVMEQSQARSCVVSEGLEHDNVRQPVEGAQEELLILQANDPIELLCCSADIIVSEIITFYY